MIVETKFWLITNVYKERFQYVGFISTHNHMDKIKNGQLIQFCILRLIKNQDALRPTQACK